MDIEHDRQSTRQSSDADKKTYYISVQAGQILQSPEEAAYELVIRGSQEDVAKLEELFEELSSMDEAETFHFAKSPYGTAGNSEINRGSDDILLDIYRHLYQCGTDETKRHIATMGLF